MGFPGDTVVQNLPAKQETWIWSLDREDPLEKKMATNPVFLPGEFHGQKSLTGYSPWVWKGLEDLAAKQQNTQTQIRRAGIRASGEICLNWWVFLAT